jgi:signal transduction histidine kinase
VKTEKDVTRGREGAAGRARRTAAPGGPAWETLDHLGGLVGLDAGWVVRSTTPGLARLVGADPETVIGEPLGALLAPGTIEPTIAALADAVRAGTHAAIPAMLSGGHPIVLIPIPTRAPSAEIHVVVTDIVPDAGASRGPQEVAEVFRSRLTEVEEQLAQRAILAEVDADLAASLDPAEVSRRIADHAARLCRVPRAYLELVAPQTGLLTLSAISGLPRPTALPPARPEVTLASRAAAAGAPLEARQMPHDPRYAPYCGGEHGGASVALAVPLMADRQALGALVLCRHDGRAFDEPEVQRAQQLASRAALAIRNAQRHADLAQEVTRLRDTQTEVVRTEKMSALGRLAAGAAHEINNPLAAVVGNAELLMRREALPHTAHARAEQILHAAYRVSRIVDQLLAFVRARPPVLAPTDLVRLLRESVDDRARDIELNGVLILDELDDLPPVAADARQLRQVFSNILDNALDAVRERPEGQPRTIRLGGEVVDERARLRIENSGPPIGEAVLPRIFDPFFTTKEVGRGSGLGLSVCEGVIAAHGGRIRAEDLDAGVAVMIELPIAGPPTSPPAA